MSEVKDRAHRSSARTRLIMPPYGRELAAARTRGELPNVFIHAGDYAWDRAKLRSPPDVLCLPPDGDFRDYDWTPVKKLALTLIVWGRPNSWIDEFATHLVRAGAELVCALNAHQGDNKKVESMFYRMRPT